MSFEIAVLIEQQDAIRQGLLTTLAISMVSTILAIILGVLVAIGRKLPLPPLRWILQSYVQVLRNTPLLVQLYLFYKGLPHLGLILSPIICGILALSLQTSAYMAEIFRAGIESIPREQYEGGRSLGFSRRQTYLTVIFPQALGVILPPLGNQVVGLVKNSSLVAFITVPDLFFVLFKGGADEFRYLEFFTLGILLYMSLTLCVSLLFNVLERKIPFIKHSREALHAG